MVDLPGPYHRQELTQRDPADLKQIVEAATGQNMLQIMTRLKMNAKDRVRAEQLPSPRCPANGRKTAGRQRWTPDRRWWAFLLATVAGLSTMVTGPVAAAPPDSALEVLPPAGKADAGKVELGRLLFFDGRLSGDSTISCATCHQPAKAWCDGLPLSLGYPGSLYFRNTPTLLNATLQTRFYRDGRLDGKDVSTVVRDHIAEAHFMQADGRLVIERLRQVPEYVQRFQQAFGGEPTYGRILNAVAAFLVTLRSGSTPLDRFLKGDREALDAAQQRGFELFGGKAGCIRCHDGPLLSDGKFHGLGVPPAAAVFSEPMRHITYRRFLRTLGVTDFERVRADVGLYAVTKRAADRGRFRTPSLREASRTAPYMHNGSLNTLAEVVAFYNRGGGPAPGKDPLLQPLGLSASEQRDLVAFLRCLASNPVVVRAPRLPKYELLPTKSQP